MPPSYDPRYTAPDPVADYQAEAEQIDRDLTSPTAAVLTVNGATPDANGDVAVATAPEIQDSGWRRLSLPSGWTGDAYVRRVADTVVTILQGIKVSGTFINGTVVIAPAGFIAARPGSVNGAVGVMAASGGTSALWQQLDGQVKHSGVLEGQWYYGSFTYLTTDPWPTVLPGTAA